MTPKHLKPWSLPSHYIGECWYEYYSAGVSQHRDSDCLERSNFQSMLEHLGGESDTVTVVSENHWAVGWVEWIAIHQNDERSLQIADAIQAKLQDYPVINEDHWGELEMEEANQVWRECYQPQERIEYIRQNRSQFEFQNLCDMLACVRGEYFAGYASELLTR
jgi:hypothetical protein